MGRQLPNAAASLLTSQLTFSIACKDRTQQPSACFAEDASCDAGKAQKENHILKVCRFLRPISFPRKTCVRLEAMLQFHNGPIVRQRSALEIHPFVAVPLPLETDLFSIV